MSAYTFDTGRNGAKNECLGMSSKSAIAESPNENIIKLYETTPVYATDTKNPESMVERRNPWKNKISSRLACEKYTTENRIEIASSPSTEREISDGEKKLKNAITKSIPYENIICIRAMSKNISFFHSKAVIYKKNITYTMIKKKVLSSKLDIISRVTAYSKKNIAV
jgi:hypothetical protein